MSILIRGMEMPTSCADCRLMADGWCYSVGLEQREKISTVKRPTWCPLVPVPPHGRLIDADAILKALNISGSMTDCAGCKHMGNYGCKSGAWATVCDELTHTPTIITAEEGE